MNLFLKIMVYIISIISSMGLMLYIESRDIPGIIFHCLLLIAAGFVLVEDFK